MRDWNDSYKDSFFDKLKELQKERRIDLISFTGDLIDKGGKDFGGASQAFTEFEKNIIYPILEFLELEMSRFIICPGNHDINRFADDEIDEIGLKGTLTTSEKIITFIENTESKKSFKRIERIHEYKSFESKLYENITDEKVHSIFKFSVKFKVGEKLIGVSSINSSWRCFDNNDYENIIIGEKQLPAQS